MVAAPSLTGTGPTLPNPVSADGIAGDTIGALSVVIGPTAAGNVLTGATTLGLTNITVGVQAGGNTQSTISGSLDFGNAARTITVWDGPNASDLVLNAIVSGQTGATITKAGSGTLELAGSGRITAAGNFTVNEGTLLLNKTVGPAILGSLTIGDGLGGPQSDIVRYGAAAGADQIAEYSGAGNAVINMTLGSSGLLDLNGKSDTIVGNGLLTLNVAPSFSSEIRTGSGILTLAGNLTVNTAAQTHSGTPAATISGKLDLGKFGTRTITTNDSAAANDLVISADITGVGGTEAGLAEGFFNTGAAIDLAPNPGFVSRLLPRLGEVFINPSPLGLWNTNQTWVYTGQFFDADGLFAFGENIDDRALVTIDGVVRLTNASAAQNTSTGSLTNNPSGGVTNFGMGPAGDGWHNIEIRFSNGTGGAGGTTGSGWTAALGFGLNNNPGALTSILGTDFIVPVDPGDATLFRTSAAANLLTAGLGRVMFTGNNTYAGTTTVSAGELLLGQTGTLATSGITLSTGGTLTLDNTVTNNNNRLPDVAPITLAGGTLNYLANSAGSTEAIGVVTVASGSSIIQSTTAGGTALLTSADLVRNPNATVSFVGINTDLGTTNNRIKFTGVPNNTNLPFATVVSGNGGAQLAIHTTVAGIQGVPNLSQTTVYKTSLAEVTSPTDFVRLTKSETINSAITVAGIEFNGDNITIGGTGSLIVRNGGNELQQLTFANSPVGDFTISYGNLTTAAITYSAVPATMAGAIQTQLNTIFGAGNTLVLPGAADVYTIAFMGNLANANLDEITTDVTNLGGGSATPATLLQGAGNEVQSLTLGGVASDTVTLAFNTILASAPLTAPFTGLTAAQLLANLNTIPALTGNVAVIGAVGGPFQIVFRNGLGGTNIAPLTAVLTGTASAVISTVSDGINLLAGSALTVTGANPSSAVINVPVILANGADDTIQVDAGNTLNITGTLIVPSGATLHKRGTGTLNLPGDNTATLLGAVSLEEGVIGVSNNGSLGTATTTVSAGAAIALSGGLTGVTAPLTLNGTGSNNGGAIRNVAGANVWSANITLGSNASLNVATGSFTTTGTVAGNTLTKFGTGDFIVGGAGANTSSLTIAQGKLILNKTAAVNAAAAIIVGDDFGGDNADVLQVAATAAVRQQISGLLTVTSSGLVDLNDKDLLVTGGATLGIGQTSSGDIQGGPTNAGTLVLGGNVTVVIAAAAGNAAATGSAPAATISAKVNLNDAARTITSIDHASANAVTTSVGAIVGNDDLLISGVISSTTPASGSLVIAGTGRVALTGDNTFAGGVTLNAANVFLTARHLNALGTAGNVTIGAAATLEFDGITGTFGAGAPYRSVAWERRSYWLAVRLPTQSADCEP